MITEIYNYDMSDGNETFDRIVLLPSKKLVKIQAKFRANANDATLEIRQSENGLNFDTIKDGAGTLARVTLDATVTEIDESGIATASATINFNGIETLYIKPYLVVNSVTVGTFIGLYINTAE